MWSWGCEGFWTNLFFYESNGGGANVVNHGYTNGDGLGAEIVGTFVLVYTVFSTTDAKRNARDSHVPSSPRWLSIQPSGLWLWVSLASSSSSSSSPSTTSSLAPLDVREPQRWDKLFLSIISVETGRTITKSGKASVRNGNCQWEEALSESIWISPDDFSIHIEECLVKLVAMGSARFGTLGEATINLISYMNLGSSTPVSMPLKKCNRGAILQDVLHLFKSHQLHPITK
ncbi:hypothetical protein SO802_005055 [Lithocarpus litseifolius]|uniref:C2 NT-type domain-containing protein n=1 Tax=Lithocarpus litseifolius TaxID=425828 RepID=A0AAW2DJI2_9ROSI